MACGAAALGRSLAIKNLRMNLLRRSNYSAINFAGVDFPYSTFLPLQFETIVTYGVYYISLVVQFIRFGSCLLTDKLHGMPLSIFVFYKQYPYIIYITELTLIFDLHADVQVIYCKLAVCSFHRMRFFWV